MESKSVAIIPARAGSLGLPGKNFKPILKEPLIYWSLLAAYKSDVSKIVVTTNCRNVRVIAKEFGMDHLCGKRIQIITRPEELCTATASTEDAMHHALNHLDEKFDNVVLLQPTSPVRKNNIINRCISILNASYKYDSVFTCSRHTPFFYSLKDENCVEAIRENEKRVPRQLLQDNQWFYHDNGNVYVTRMDAFMKYGRIGRKATIQEQSSFESMQIDTEEDFVMMEALAKKLGGFL